MWRFPVVCAVMLGLCVPARSAPGAVDLAFAPQIKWPEPKPDPRDEIDPLRELALALQVDGKILLGGSFHEVNGIRVPPLVRLNPDGSLDPTFQAPEGIEKVNEILLDIPGKIYLRGLFFFNHERSGWDRLELDGARDHTFHRQGPSGHVGLRPDGSMLFSGNFTTLNGITKPYLAKFTPAGELDPEFQPPTQIDRSLSSHFCSFHFVPNDKFIAAGYITVSNSPSRSIHRFFNDGRLDESFKVEPGELWFRIVEQAEVLPNGKIILVNSHRDRLWRLNPNGSLDHSFQNGTSELEFFWMGFKPAPDGRIVVVMQENALGTGFNLVRLMPDGSLDASFDVGAGPGDWWHERPYVPKPLVEPNGDILIHGNFNSFDGVPRTGLVRLKGDLLTTLQRVEKENDRIVMVLVGNEGASYRLEASVDLQEWEVAGEGAFGKGPLRIEERIESDARFFRVR